MKTIVTLKSSKARSTALILALLLAITLPLKAQNSWERQFKQSSATMMDVAYGAGKYVSVGGSNSIRTSTDGMTWQIQPTSLGESGILSHIIYANGRFVAVGSYNTIATSTDGLSWNVQTGEITENFNGIAYGNGVFVAVGPSGSVSTSQDGLNWTSRPLATTGRLYHVTYNNGIFAAVGQYGLIQISSDNGVTWVVRTSGTSESLRGVTAGKNGSFVAVGNHGTILFSPTGSFWNLKTGADTDMELSAVSFNPATGSFVAVCSNRSKVVYSVGGLIWTVAQSGSNRFFSGVRFLQNEFIAVGQDLVSRFSFTGGKTWYSTKPEFANMLMNGVVFGNGRFVAVGQAPQDNGTTGAKKTNLIITTTDGVHYEAAETIHLYGGANAFNDVAFGNGLFVAVGEDAIIQTSPNGLKWNYCQVNFGQTLKGIAFGYGRFVAVGTNGLILWSLDGKTWTKATPPLNANYNGVAFVNGQFMAVGKMVFSRHPSLV